MEAANGEENAAEPPKKKRYSRVSRACNECRTRKIRCDGSQPCQVCEAFERHCSYLSSQAQKPRGDQRIRMLEDRLRRAQTYIRELQSQIPASTQADLDAILTSPGQSPASTHEGSNSRDDGNRSPQLENMLGCRGRMSALDHKKAEFYGGCSGFAFLQRTKEFLDENEGASTDSSHSGSTQRVMTQLFDSPLPNKQALDVDVPISHLLPSRHTASTLVHTVFDRTYPLYQFLHKPTFQEKTDRIYDLEPMDFDDSDHDFLPLFYVVIALGFLFSQHKHQTYGCDRAISQAIRHFIAARQMIDVTSCRNLVSLQVLICLILFLMSTARIATAHTFVAVAVASAVRLGLHSGKSVNENLPDLERNIRLRVFWTIVKLDIYTGSVLGLPALINLEDVDQVQLPEAFNDSAKHLEILTIITKAIKFLYPLHVKSETGRGTFLVSNTKIVEVEQHIKQWRESLSDLLRGDGDAEYVTSIKYDLEMMHNFGYIILYRPFLHYLAKTGTESEPDERQLRCALTYTKIAQNTILQSELMLQQGFLCPASWHCVYTVFLSVVALIFFLATNGNAPEAPQVQHSAEVAVRILSSTSCQDIGSTKCLDVLKVLVSRLSGVVKLDIDQIQSEARSLCQADTPKGEARAEAATEWSQNTMLDQPSLDWIAPASNGSSIESSSTPWPTQDWQNYTPTGIFDVNQPHALLPQHSTDFQTQPDTMYPQLMGLQSAGSYNTGSSNFHTSNQGHSQPSFADAMEIPYSDEFAWPFQVSAGQGDAEDGHFAPMDMENVQIPVSPQDIAAFMRINPAEHPFL